MDVLSMIIFIKMELQCLSNELGERLNRLNVAQLWSANYMLPKRPNYCMFSFRKPNKKVFSTLL